MKLVPNDRPLLLAELNTRANNLEHRARAFMRDATTLEETAGKLRSEARAIALEAVKLVEKCEEVSRG